MKIIESLKQGIYTKYQTSTLWTADAIPFYMDHVPQSVCYPIICCYYISSGNYMSMGNTTQPAGYNYIDSRMQFTIYGNDRQNVQITDIASRLEDVYHRQSMILPNGVTFIAGISLNQRTLFFDQNLKIWSLRTDFRFLAGA